jgi:uncharacterized protein (TIGR02646 family)
MNRSVRRPQPELFAKWADEVSQAYVKARTEDPSYRFQWPRREGRSLYDVARTALAEMTDRRCSYCDSDSIDATGVESVDHFRPKSNPEFYALVCAWTNLFLVCSSCNHAKREQWTAALLKPDDIDYEFTRYFSYQFDTGRIIPNAAASSQERNRAQETIQLLDLNRPGLCTRRMRTTRLIRSAASDEERNDVGYRYLVPLSV